MFGLAGVEAALEALLAFVAVLERHRRGWAEATLRRDRLSAVEDCVLRLFSALQAGDELEADAVTTWLVVNLGAAPLQQAARRFVARLNDAGQILDTARASGAEGGRTRPIAVAGAAQSSVDRVSDLTRDERLLLGGIRAWVARIKQDQCGWPPGPAESAVQHDLVFPLKVCLLDFLSDGDRRDVIRHLADERRAALDAAEVAMRRCQATGRYTRLWLRREVERLNDDVGWLEQLVSKPAD